MYEQINGSILIISHQERILEIADKIVVIAAGRITAEGLREGDTPGLMNPSGPAAGLRPSEGGAAWIRYSRPCLSR